jgi:hypothetical protein
MSTRLIFIFILYFSLTAFGKNIYFKCDNGEIFSIDENTLLANTNNTSELAVKLARKGSNKIGTETRKNPTYIDVSGHYFDKYIIIIMTTGRVMFSTFADAINRLIIAQQLGLRDILHPINWMASCS